MANNQLEYFNKQGRCEQASELNVASALTAGTDVTLTARETDLNVIGSTVKAGQDITLDAARAAFLRCVRVNPRPPQVSS
ncbi:hypothetical protein FHX09_006086 [Rhizobium sp. BK538]|nr:hypothetical protein [Rhizobium sp. BK538]